MFSVKHLVAAITLGTAMLMAPSAVTAKTVHHSSTTATHSIKHKKKHKRVHHKHSTKTSTTHVKSSHLVAHSTSKHLTAASASKHSTSKHKKVAVSHKTAFRHHPNL